MLFFSSPFSFKEAWSSSIKFCLFWMGWMLKGTRRKNLILHHCYLGSIGAPMRNFGREEVLSTNKNCIIFTSPFHIASLEAFMTRDWYDAALQLWTWILIKLYGSISSLDITFVRSFRRRLGLIVLLVKNGKRGSIAGMLRSRSFGQANCIGFQSFLQALHLIHYDYKKTVYAE